MTTVHSLSTEERQRKWQEFDAEKETAGRLASKVASVLRGKDKISFAYHHDQGDFVVVKNVEQLRFTGKKSDQKIYYRHSGYPGGIRQRTLELRKTLHPQELFRDMVKGMLPKTTQGRAMLKRLKFISGQDNPYQHLIQSS